MTDYFSEPGTSRTEIYQELAQLRLIDPHTHINPHAPASTTLADLLGYHYYTELARSAGMPKSRIEDPSIGPKELVERLVGGLGPIENTIQYSWLIAICRMFFGFDEDKLHLNNWEELYDRSESIMTSAQWPDMVLDQSNVEAVFLTNDFDDDLAGFDSDRYIPCLRTDDLVFHLADPKVRGRLAACTGVEIDGSLSSLRASLRQRFEHFVGRGARACAISLPPSFTPTSVADGRASTALDSILRNGLTATSNDKDALSRRVFWTLAELCDEFGLPFDLMIGVNRKVYPDGVYQGQDLFDSRVSLIQYKDLFNAFPDVKFPVSVLASVTNQELVSYAWIFPNVYPNGHWWYSNTPSTIKHDLGARLDAVPQTKMIGYYSDAYKLEFVWPKFDMYRKTLATVLAEDFVGNRGWSIERAVELGRQVLKENTEEIFPRVTPPAAVPNDAAADSHAIEINEVETFEESESEPTPSPVENLGTAASLAAGSAAAAAAAVGLAAAEVFEEVVSEDQNEASDEASDEARSEGDQLVEIDEEHEDTFDTMVMEPAQREAGDASDSSRESDSDDFEDDLGATTVLNEHLTELGSEDDSKATIVENQPADNPDRNEILAVEHVDSDQNADSEDLSATMEAPFPFIGQDPADRGEAEEIDLESAIPSDFTRSMDPTPDDEEIGELGLDDVELIDPAASRAADPDALSAEVDDEPLDVGDLMSVDDEEPALAINPESEGQSGASDDSPAADDFSSDDDSLLVFESLDDDGDEAPSGDDAQSGDAQIRQLTGDSSFAPDDESLQLDSDPLTGELNFKVSGDDDVGEELKLSPPSIDPAASDDDHDELNLEFLNEREDED